MAGADRPVDARTVNQEPELQFREEFNKLVADVRAMQTVFDPSDQVLPWGNAAGLDVDDGNAADIESNATIHIRYNGAVRTIAAEGAIDISAASAGAATIGTSQYGVAWVFVGVDDTWDVEVDMNAQVYTSAVRAWAAYSIAANTLPPTAGDVPVGAVLVLEGGSGAFTWGTGSITDEGETYVDFLGRPSVVTAMASFALNASEAHFTYGAATVRLGSGAIISATGKANATLQAGTVADGAVGAWLFYILADDVEVAVPLGVAYASVAAAQAAVNAHNPNPYLALAGVIYVQNNSGSDFVGGTTELDVTGITCTFTTLPAGSEIGRVQPAYIGTAGLITTYNRVRPVGT